jgi:hypothetical protein
MNRSSGATSMTPDLLIPGSFRKVANLLSPLNDALALFDMTEPLPEIEVSDEGLVGAAAEGLLMLDAAVQEAIADGVLEPSMALDLNMLEDDKGLSLLAGKLKSIAKSKDFKRFLAEPKPEPVEMEETETEPQELTEDEFMALLTRRGV